MITTDFKGTKDFFGLEIRGEELDRLLSIEKMYKTTKQEYIDNEGTYVNVGGRKYYRKGTGCIPKIEKVIFNDPATIIIWKDETKTVVKAGEGEAFDPEKGLAMALAKKSLGNAGNYYNTFRKWLEGDAK